MVGFRNKLNAEIIPNPYNYTDPRFEGLFNFSPIPTGKLTTNYVDFSDYEVPEVIVEEPPAPVIPYRETASDDRGGDGPSSDDGDHGGYAGDAPGSEAGTYNSGGNVPPMYANQGEIATNTPYGYSDEQRARQQAAHNARVKAGMDAKIKEENARLIEDAIGIGGFLNQGQNFVTNQLTDYSNFAKSPSKENFGKVVSKSINPASIVNYALGGPPIIGAPLIEKTFDVLNEIGRKFGDAGKAKTALAKEINSITGGSIYNNPTAAAYSAVGDYEIDDTNPTKGAIPGDYSPGYSKITASYSLEPAVARANAEADRFRADLEAAIAEIDSEYEDFTSSYSNTDFDDNGGGYDPDNAGHSPGSNANASDSNTGMGMGIGGGNDGFRFAGGKIYASQGGYINSTGGK